MNEIIWEFENSKRALVSLEDGGGGIYFLRMGDSIHSSASPVSLTRHDLIVLYDAIGEHLQRYKDK